MTNYDIFDEKYYLAQYPWVQPLIDAGIFKSAREHLEKFGQGGGVTKVSRYFDEQTYLGNNPDIPPFIRAPNNNPNAPFASGLDQFIRFGYEEGRTGVSPDYDEAFYLATNRDILPFIQNGTFKNGYQHFVKFGSKEGRFGTPFFESDYLKQNPDIVPFVKSGTFTTGREHYVKYGQFESTRSATFVGSSGNDIVTGFGAGNVEIIGVEVGVERAYGARLYESDGSNEFDTLTGGIGNDKFVLGDYQDFARNINRGAQLYIGPGFATIVNFTKGKDSIQLSGSGSLDGYIDGYILFPINNNQDLAIQTKGFDTVAVIQGGGNLSLNVLPEYGFGKFLLG